MFEEIKKKAIEILIDEKLKIKQINIRRYVEEIEIEITLEKVSHGS